MTATAALLVARLALGADGGYLDACPDAADAGPAEQRDGGWWLPTPRGERLACRLAGCEAMLKGETQPVPTPVALLVGLGVGLVAGAVGGGYLAWKLAR